MTNFYPGKFGNLDRGDLVLLDPSRLHAAGPFPGLDEPNVQVEVVSIRRWGLTLARVDGLVGDVPVYAVVDPLAACAFHSPVRFVG